MRYLLIFALVASALAQEPLCQKTVVDADMHISYEAIPCPVSWRTLPPPHRSWVYRHRKLLVVTVGSAIGAVVGFKLAYRPGCKSSYNGVPYNGNINCPTECYSLGNCEWGTQRSHK
jgi:hypothetical protein